MSTTINATHNNNNSSNKNKRPSHTNNIYKASAELQEKILEITGPFKFMPSPIKNQQQEQQVIKQQSTFNDEVESDDDRFSHHGAQVPQGNSSTYTPNRQSSERTDDAESIVTATPSSFSSSAAAVVPPLPRKVMHAVRTRRYLHHYVTRFVPPKINSTKPDLLVFHYDTDLFMPPTMKAPEGTKVSSGSVGHNFSRMIKRYGADFGVAVLWTVLYRMNVPVYFVRYNEADRLLSFSTDDSLVQSAVVELERRILFDECCFWFADTAEGVTAIHNYCVMLQYLNQYNNALIRGLPGSAMTCTIHRSAFSNKTCFPRSMEAYTPLDGDHRHQNFFNKWFKLNAERKAYFAANPQFLITGSTHRAFTLDGRDANLTTDAEIAYFNACVENYMQIYNL